MGLNLKKKKSSIVQLNRRHSFEGKIKVAQGQIFPYLSPLYSAPPLHSSKPLPLLGCMKASIISVFADTLIETGRKEGTGYWVS